MKKLNLSNDELKNNSNENKTKYNMRKITIGSNVVYKPVEPTSECNPNNGEFFEERNNPLSSKGN